MKIQENKELVLDIFDGSIVTLIKGFYQECSTRFDKFYEESERIIEVYPGLSDEDKEPLRSFKIGENDDISELEKYIKNLKEDFGLINIYYYFLGPIAKNQEYRYWSSLKIKFKADYYEVTFGRRIGRKPYEIQLCEQEMADSVKEEMNNHRLKFRLY